MRRRHRCHRLSSQSGRFNHSRRPFLQRRPSSLPTRRQLTKQRTRPHHQRPADPSALFPACSWLAPPCRPRHRSSNHYLSHLRILCQSQLCHSRHSYRLTLQRLQPMRYLRLRLSAPRLRWLSARTRPVLSPPQVHSPAWPASVRSPPTSITIRHGAFRRNRSLSVKAEATARASAS